MIRTVLMATSTQTHVYVRNDGMAVSNDHPANLPEPAPQQLPVKPYYRKYVGALRATTLPTVDLGLHNKTIHV